MATAFRTATITVPGGSGTKVLEGAAFFNTDVRSADVAIKSFRFDYSSSDHHINVVEVRSEVLSTPGTAARVRVVCQYADQNFDDAYTGSIQLLVVADVA